MSRNVSGNVNGLRDLDGKLDVVCDGRTRPYRDRLFLAYERSKWWTLLDRPDIRRGVAENRHGVAEIPIASALLAPY